MAALAARALVLRGQSEPRLAPPIPARSRVGEYEATAKELGIKLMPWQHIAGRYLTAVYRGSSVYREVAVIVARQNGKTHLLLPFILMELKRGLRLLHTAQNRELPRETFEALADFLESEENRATYGVRDIRRANGQQQIKLANGGRYTLVAPRPGVRGHHVDKVLLDEVREQKDFNLIAGIKPTLTASRDPQIIYLSNAGDEDSVVLNDLRRRRESTPRLAYIEWSASPERTLDDRAGWAESNPALGITIAEETLADELASLPPGVFETEHLCRWIISTQPRLVSDIAWQRARAELEQPVRTFMGISMDPSGTRASGVLAWQQADGSIACRVVADVTGEPIDTDRLGKDLAALALKNGVATTGFDDWTDKELARHLLKSKAINGREYANASENFVRIVDGGRLRWDIAEQITTDLGYTARKPHESGSWTAVKAKDDRPITAVLAGIRATWLASGPRPTAPRVY